jgi:Glycosyltransferase family 87
MSIRTRAQNSARPRQATAALSPITFAGMILALLAGLTVLWAFYTRKGAYGSDWLTFYQAAERWRDGAQVYSVAGGFFNPPPVLLLMRLFILLPYGASRVLWGTLSAAMLLLSALLAANAAGWNPTAREKILGAWWILVSAPVVLLAPLTGNWSALVLLSFTASLTLFRHGRDGWAGAVLACTLVKPQLAILTLPLLLYKRRWRAALGYLTATLGSLLLTLPLTGPQVFRDYLAVQRSVSGWTSNNDALQLDVPGLHGMFLQRWPHLFLAEAAADLCSLAVVLALAWFWRGPWQPRSARFTSGWALVALATMLVSSFAHSYDLVLLIVPAVTLYAAHLRPAQTPAVLRPWLVPSLVVLYIAPFLVLIYRHHFMVPPMLAIGGLIWFCAPPPGAAGSRVRVPAIWQRLE